MLCGQGDHIGRFFTYWATFKVSKVVCCICFGAFKFSFVEDILEYFRLGNFLGYNFGDFFISSGHPVCGSGYFAERCDFNR